MNTSTKTMVTDVDEVTMYFRAYPSPNILFLEH